MHPQEKEDILAIPRIWTKRAYQLLIEHKAVPRPWHLEGRWGSRTHRVDDERMGFPIISKQDLEEKATEHAEIRELLQVEGVEILEGRPFVRSKRAKEPVVYDATIHAEKRGQSPSDLSMQTNSHGVPDATALFTYAEMFCGVGGFGVALDALGGKCVFASEIDANCRSMYMANFSTPRELIHGDIYEVKDSELPHAGTLDLLVAGFPCQPFSNMSTQPGFNCEKGRGLLFQQIVRVLDISKPKAFLLENVPGLRDMGETFEHILGSFQGSGYQVFTDICSSRGLTATSRKRLFFFGFRNDLGVDSFELSFVPDLQLKAENVLDYDAMPEEELEVLRLSNDTMNRLINCGRWRPHSLAWPNTCCDTITSHYGNAVGRGESQLVPCHAPNHPRRFSPRECARLMGFPNTYRLIPQNEKQSRISYYKQLYRMFGNAVCPPLIAALAGCVLDPLGLSVDGKRVNLVDRGLRIAIFLAHEATRSCSVVLPLGCLVFEGSKEDSRED